MTNTERVLFGTDIPDPVHGYFPLPFEEPTPINGDALMDERSFAEPVPEPGAFDAAPYLLVAVIITSALYLSGVFIAGLVTDHRLAWLLALATMGICYLSAMVQLAAPTWRMSALLIVGASVVCGIWAGLELL